MAIAIADFTSARMYELLRGKKKKKKTVLVSCIAFQILVFS